MSSPKDDYLHKLRHQAETLSRERNEDAGSHSMEEIRRLLHELQVHQIELELQNEELRRSQQEIEASRNSFLHLFHNAPVGYLVLDSLGMIRQANETFCRMVQQDTPGMTNRPFSQFIPEPERHNFNSRYQAIFKNPGGKSMELPLLYPVKGPLYVRIEAAPMPLLTDTPCLQQDRRLLITVSDISERKQSEQKIKDYTQRLEQLYHKLDAELNKARQAHEQTLPTKLPAIKGVTMAAHYQPAQKMGGDFFDVIYTGKKLVFYLSDVSGHGLDGAMLSVFVKHTIKSYISFKPAETITPAKIIRHLAEQFHQENYPEELYIAIFLAVLDLDVMELTYCGAGFQETLLVRLGNGEQLNLFSKGLFISRLFPVDTISLKEESINLTSGCTIFCNTDGLTEQQSNGLYYMDRLPHIFFENANLPAHLVARQVVDDFRIFNNGVLQGKDDITFLVLQTEKTTPKLRS